MHSREVPSMEYTLTPHGLCLNIAVVWLITGVGCETWAYLSHLWVWCYPGSTPENPHPSSSELFSVGCTQKCSVLLFNLCGFLFLFLF